MARFNLELSSLMRSIFLKIIHKIVVCLVMASCSLHSVNRAPDPLFLSGEFPLGQGANSRGENDSFWWQSIEDSTLHQLIEEGFDKNLTVAKALARVAAAKALFSSASAQLFPQVDLVAGAIQAWDTEQRLSHQLQLGGIVNWDFDLFGRLRATRLARFYDFQEQYFLLSQARLSLSSQIAQSYYRAVEQRLLLELLNDQLNTDRELLDLVRRSFEAGVVSRVDLLQQKGQLAGTRALIPLAEMTLRLYENSLDVLLGGFPDGLSRLEDSSEFPRLPDLPELGVPADLLLNRPDLRAAAAALVSSDAEIGRAIAELLPGVTIGGGARYISGTGASGIISDLVGSFIQPLLTWGEKRAEIRRTKALYLEALFDFTQLFIEAAEQVDDAHFRLLRQNDYLERLLVRKDIIEQTLEETKRRYSAGLTDYLPVLDTLQDLRSLERDIVSQRRALVGYYIDLQVSLGGLPL